MRIKVISPVEPTFIVDSQVKDSSVAHLTIAEIFEIGDGEIEEIAITRRVGNTTRTEKTTIQ